MRSSRRRQNAAQSSLGRQHGECGRLVRAVKPMGAQWPGLCRLWCEQPQFSVETGHRGLRHARRNTHSPVRIQIGRRYVGIDQE